MASCICTGISSWRSWRWWAQRSDPLRHLSRSKNMGVPGVDRGRSGRWEDRISIFKMSMVFHICPKIGGTSNHHPLLEAIFREINHPFWGYRHLWNFSVGFNTFRIGCWALIYAQVQKHQSSVLIGETGSGKTTQVWNCCWREPGLADEDRRMHLHVEKLVHHDHFHPCSSSFDMFNILTSPCLMLNEYESSFFPGFQ